MQNFVSCYGSKNVIFSMKIGDFFLGDVQNIFLELVKVASVGDSNEPQKSMFE